MNCDKTSNEYLEELLEFTQGHSQIALRIHSIYPPTFSLQYGEYSTVEARIKAYGIFLKSTDAIHKRASQLVSLQHVKISLLAAIEKQFGELTPNEPEENQQHSLSKEINND